MKSADVRGLVLEPISTFDLRWDDDEYCHSMHVVAKRLDNTILIDITPSVGSQVLTISIEVKE